MDEAPEFRITVLQALREPLEDRIITISRAEGPVQLPADFQLILAANSCPCGRLGAKRHENLCFCSTDEVYRYRRRIGGALMDRIELRTNALIPEPGSALLNTKSSEDTSAIIASRVLRAVEIQRSRFKKDKANNVNNIRRNASMIPMLIALYCPMTDRAREELSKTSVKLNFSGRAYHGIIRTARTIADLEEKEVLDTPHIQEAVEHRRLGDDPFDFLS